MIAHKFLRPGLVGPFTGFRWEPGAWVGEGGAPDLCVSGVHACRVGDLPYWVNRELWEIELDGEIVAGERKVTASRGRLLRRIEGWDEAAERTLAETCAVRARAFADARPDDEHLVAMAADADSLAATGLAHVATYVAAVAAERAGGPAGRAAERETQADWFAELLR